MSRLPAMHVAAIALLALCFCLLRASSAADTSLISHGLQENKAPASLGANDQVVAAVAGEAEKKVGVGRMDLELEDYPGSGANDRHSPWGQRRN